VVGDGAAGEGVDFLARQADGRAFGNGALNVLGGTNVLERLAQIVGAVHTHAGNGQRRFHHAAPIRGGF